MDVAQFEVAPLSTESAPRFLLIGRLLGDKGVREYVQAAEQVKQRYPLVQFDLVGWIDANPNTITQPELDRWVAAGTINFLGRLSDVRPAIANSSVYVLPSYREGTPRTVLEAMAMGRAVITTDALAQAMLRFIEQPELIIQMGQRSREIAEEKYDVHKVNAQMLAGMGLD